MIKKLTSHQESLIPEYFNKHLKLGYDTSRINRKEVSELIKEYYKASSLEPPKLILYFDSPLGCSLGQFLVDKGTFDPENRLREFIVKQLGGQLWEQLWDQLEIQPEGQFWVHLGKQLRGQLLGRFLGQLLRQCEDQLWDQLKDQLEVQLRGQLRDQIGDQLWHQLGGQLWDQLGNQLGNQLRAQLWAQLGNQLWGQLEEQLGKQLYSYIQKCYTWGCVDSFWISFYRFIIDQLPVRKDQTLIDRFNLFEKLSLQIFWWFPYKNICFVSEKPTEIHRSNNRVHNENGPAMRFADGYGLYALNGVTVPKEVVETPAEELDPKLITSEQNVEIRREIVRKIGSERLLQKLGSSILDKDGTYELHKISLTENVQGIALKMVNPSTGDIHIEWVDDSCTTCKEANIWRRGGIVEEPIVLT